MNKSAAATFIAGASEPGHFPRLDEPEIAFAGRSNVGKSSLLNRLVGRHNLARVSKTPGRTQQINFFRIDNRTVFVDLPGYGFARVPMAVKDQWKQLVESYLTSRRNLRGVVVLVDLRRLLQDEDVQLIEFLRALEIRTLVVATKADKLARGERMTHVRQLQPATAELGAALVVCSASSGEGIAELRRALEVLVKGTAPVRGKSVG